MERFIWSFNGKKFSEAEPLRFTFGERLRITLVNDSMMTHPIHLHGMWSEIENPHGQFQVRKHTVMVNPAQRITYAVTADALGRWAYHCHLLYHMRDRVEQLRQQGRTVIFLSVDGRLAGALAVGDPIKETTPAALEALKEDGLRLVMLTGDSQTTARAVAATLPIDEVIAEVQPQDKVDVVARLQEQGRRVAMAGDGINDAPALAKADVGIAMGTGTDIAMESAQVTLVKGDLRGIVRARQLSRATVRNIRQNLLFAFGYNMTELSGRPGSS